MKICPICLTHYETGIACPKDGGTLVLENPEDPLIGLTIKDTYKIESMLGEGGMSKVYLATQLTLNRQVAIKVVRSEMTQSREFIQLFLREARTASQINHPNVISVFDFGNTAEGMTYLVTEFLPGKALDDSMKDEKGLTKSGILALMKQICSGMGAAHQLGIVHRDLKPANIVLAKLSDNTKVAKILDFGISKPLMEQDSEYTRAGMVMGTPGYLSPEQITGGSDIDIRADIYSLGALLYFLICGRKPFSGQTQQIIMHKQTKEAPDPINKDEIRDPEALCFMPAIEKAMAIDRDKRYPNTKTLFSDLLRLAKKGIIQNDDGKTVIAPTEQFAGKAFAKEETVKEEAPVVNSAMLTTATQVATTASANATQTEDATSSVTTGLANTQTGAGLTSPFPAGSEDTVGPHTEAVYTVAGTVGKQSGKRWRWVFGLVCCLLAGIVATIYFNPVWHEKALDLWSDIVEGGGPVRGVYSDRIVIGMSAPFRGPAKKLGRAMKIGIETRIKEVNEQGGIHGRKIELRAVDDAYNPDITVKNVADFIADEDGVFAMLGNVGTANARAILPTVLEHKILLFGAFSGAEVLRKDPPDRYVFNYRASYAQETAEIVRFFIEIKKVAPEKIAVFTQHDEHGSDSLEGVKRALRSYGVDENGLIIAEYPRNSSQVDGAVRTILKHRKRIEAIVLVGTPTASALFTIKLKKENFNPLVASVSFVGSRALAENFQALGAQYGKGVHITQVVPLYTSYSTGVLKYRDALEKFAPEEEPNFVSMEGYIVASVFLNAVEKTGRQLNTESLIDALQSITSDDIGIGDNISFGPSDHQAIDRVWMTQIDENGNITELR